MGRRRKDEKDGRVTEEEVARLQAVFKEEVMKD